MKIVDDIRSQLGDLWLPAIYRKKVRGQRTRSIDVDVPPKENKPEIQYTLLGIELKVGARRFACPDLATARYMRIFARIGCPQFAIPYDITRISVIADELETSWHKMLLLFDRETSGMERASVGRFRSALIKSMRDEINEIGPGEAMPAFDRETRQRK